jgi:hypothetical protein
MLGIAEYRALTSFHRRMRFIAVLSSRNYCLNTRGQPSLAASEQGGRDAQVSIDTVAVVALVTAGSFDSNIVQAETSAAKPQSSPQAGRHRLVSHPGRGHVSGRPPATPTQVTRKPFPEIVHPESGW